MTKMLAVKDFAKAGLNTDLMQWDLPADFLTDIRNIRIIRGRLAPFGGEQLWSTLPVDFLPGFLMHVGSTSSNFWIIAGKDSVLSFDGDAYSDITVTGGYAGINNEDDWQGCRLAKIPVINNPSDYPQYWPQQSAGVLLEYLPWDATQTWEEAGESTTIMRSHKQFLFALDIVSQGVEIPDGVRWSSPADVSDIPETWDPLDTTNVAGFAKLGGDGGKIIDGLSMRDAFVVYRESGISIFDYKGGNFVWQIRHLSSTVGAISPDSIIDVKGKHYFIGDGDILVNDGNSITSLLHNRIRSSFTSNYDADNYYNSYAVTNNVASEIWFCIPTSGHTHPNIAYIYNYRDDTWAIRDIVEAPFSAYGPQSSPPATWADMNIPWNQMGPVSWNQRQLTPMDDTIVTVTKPAGAGQSGELLLPDKGAVLADSGFDYRVERIGYALEGLQNVTTITRLYPHMSGSGTVKVQVGSQDHPGSPIRWKSPVSFTPDKDRKIDVRTTGELHCFRFSNDIPGVAEYWELSGIDIEYVNAGTR